MPDDNSTGASFGVFPQMKPTRSFQDPEASKDMPVQLVRGAVKTGLGMVPDIAQTALDIAGNDTKLPLTSDWWEQKLPLKATSPEGRFASTIGEYSPFNPLMEAVPKAIGKGASIAGQGLSEAMMGQGPEWLKSVVPQPKFVHHENTPKSPNPLVGTNYKTTDLGGLLPEKPLDLESKKGAQASMWDWDSSSTNKAINEVSGEKLPQDVITHGGFLYPLDPARARQGIVGSSNEGIANRVVNRDAIARLENLMQGGTGEVIHFPTTMGPYSENFSVQPPSVLDQLLAKRYIEDPKNHAKIVNDLNTDVKLSKPKKGFPFQGFAGVETPLGQQQLYQTGIVKDGVQVVSPGNLRKALLNVAYNKKHQKAIGFNAEDISNAITEPDLIGVPKGYMGKTVISSGDMPMHTIAGSDIGSYDTRFGNDVAHYAGTLGTHIPVETIFKNQLENFDNLMRIKKGKAWDNQSDVVKRNQLINMLANSKETNFSQILDNETLDRIGKEIERQASMKKAKGGKVHMSDNLDTQWAETAFAGGGEVGAIKSMLAEAPELAHTIRGLFTKEAPDLNDLIEKIKTSDRQPVIPMPNRWFTNPEENPQVQPLVEKVLNANNMKREDFHSGAFIDPKTGLILDNQIHKDVGVAIDPLTNRPIMTTGGVTGMESLPKGQGSFTNSNLLKQGKYKPVGGDSILNDLGFIATVDKAGMGHAYGLGTDYASPVLLNNLGTGSNPTLRPRSVGDVFGIGDVVGQMQINRNGPVHDVYEKLLVAPKGSDVQGVKLSKKKGGKVTKHIIDGHEVHVHERML